MKKKLIAGAMIAFAVILPASSASAATNQGSWGSSAGNVGIISSDDIAIGSTLAISIGSQTTNLIVTAKASYPFGVGQSFYSVSGDTMPLMTGMMYSWSPIVSTPTAYSPLSIFDTVKDFLTGKLLPAIAGLVVLGISVRLAIKAVRKFSNVA